MDKSFRFGLFLAFMTVLFDALYDVVIRVAAVKWDVAPMVFVSIVYIAAAVAMLLVAGPGRLGLDTLRQPHTWLFSFLNINLSFIFLFILAYITTTEANLLVRFCIVLNLPLIWMFIGRRPQWFDGVGAVAVFVGCGLLVYDMPSSIIGVVTVLSFLYALVLVLRSLVGEFHPASNQAGDTIKDRSRVTGYVLLVTGFLFLGLALLGAFVNLQSPETHIPPVLALVFPTFEDFLHTPTIVGAIALGLFLQMPATYFFFHATIVAKTETYLAMTAILPLLTLIVEWLVSRFGVLSLDTLSVSDLWAGALITGAGLFMIYMKYRQDKKV